MAWDDMVDLRGVLCALLKIGRYLLKGHISLGSGSTTRNVRGSNDLKRLIINHHELATVVRRSLDLVALAVDDHELTVVAIESRMVCVRDGSVSGIRNRGLEVLALVGHEASVSHA